MDEVFFFGAAFLGLSSSASLSPPFSAAVFLTAFFFGASPLSPSLALALAFPFAFLALLVSAISPLASEAVSAPELSESLSLGDPESEPDAWKSSVK